LLKPGCTQLAFPLTATPVAQLFVPHWVGLEASVVAVAALPVVLLEMIAGRSAGTKVRNEGEADGPELGPARTELALCEISCGASVPLEVMGEPETAALKIIPSPVIPTLVTEPDTLPAPETNMVRTSVIEEIVVPVVTTVAIGMVVPLKPEVFDAGAQLLDVLRYT
jgi:hypothetical protein